MKYMTQKAQAVKPALEVTRPIVKPKSRLSEWQLLVIGLLAHDALMVFLAFQLSFIIRFRTSLSIFQLDVVPSQRLYDGVVAVLLPVWLIVFALSGLYSRANLLRGTRETSILFNASTICMLLVIAVDFFKSHLFLARGWLIVTWLAVFLLTSLGRMGIRGLVRYFRARGHLATPAMIVGANQEGRLLAEQLIETRYSGLQLVGFAGNEYPVDYPVFHGLHNLGTLEDIDLLVRRHHVGELVIASSALDEQQIVQLFSRYGVSEGTNLRLSSGLYQIITTGMQVSEFSSVPLVKINNVRLTGSEWLLKTLVDYVVAIPLFALLLPVFALFYIMIKLDSPGPVIYKRRVMGVNGHQFDAFKFRTMREDGDEILNAHPELKAELERTQKLKNDPRITRVGAFLRKTSLDELPQVFNILRNEMSIVGPRMISPPEMDFYAQMGINLLTVKPGITGLWQVSGRSDVSYNERVRLDMYYIRNWSFWLDLQILWRTIPAVLSRRGAY